MSDDNLKTLFGMLHLVIDGMKALGITKQDLANTLTKAHAEGREIGQQDQDEWRAKYVASQARLADTIRNAEEKLDGL